jgi:hypothetical protein
VIGLAPKALLGAADELMTPAGPDLAGRWPLATAILCRQALERALFQLWQAKAPGMQDASWRSQLLVLRRFIDPDLAARADHTWAALSAVCHQHAYDLPPTAGELSGWFTTVEEVVRAVAAAVGAGRSI